MLPQRINLNLVLIRTFPNANVGDNLQDQFALNNFCNANALFNQLQHDASMVNFMTNLGMEPAAATELLGANSAEAKLLRDILEAGAQHQQQQQFSAIMKSSNESNKGRNSSKHFTDMEIDDSEQLIPAVAGRDGNWRKEEQYARVRPSSSSQHVKSPPLSTLASGSTSSPRQQHQHQQQSHASADTSLGGATTVRSSSNTNNQHNHSKRARVENIVSNMLLVTSSNNSAVGADARSANDIELNLAPNTRTSRTEHLPTKRARMSEYEREFKLQQLQAQLYTMNQKYAMHALYAQQQQQQPKSGNERSNNNNVSHYQRASPIGMAPLVCDMNDDEKKVNRHQSSKNGDIDSVIDLIKGQIITSINHIIDNTLRSHLVDSNVNVAQTNNIRYENIKDGGKGLLSQMLDAKYTRNATPKGSSLNAISLNNGSKSSGRDGSPFALPNEASPAPKPFNYPLIVGSSFYNGNKQQQHAQAQAQQQPFYLPTMAQNFAAAYSNPTNGLTTMLNGGSNQNSTPIGRDNPSPVVPEQTEAMSLVVAPKKRRNKVTDTRLTPRTGNRLTRDEQRSSVSPPIGNGALHFNSSLTGVPASLTNSLQHASDFFDPNVAPFPFADQSRLSSLFSNGDDTDLKNGLVNGQAVAAANVVAAAAAASNPVVSAVAQAAAVHHLHMMNVSRGSPDSLNGYTGSMLNSFGRGSVTGSENGGDGSETNDTQSMYDPSMQMISFSYKRRARIATNIPDPIIIDDHDCSLTSLHTSTLSPMHLRKAKLMFFYVRYPSSSVLKMFFPDIKFNKNNTAQLVKWFSNFREFYYIQMEKYARQAISEGIKCPENLEVTDDCELLRVLNLHYNRSNHITIPERFRTVCETTLREFFRSLQLNKDTEQSWKKAIYKVIARLDDTVPEYFKNPNFMDQLE
ncbi:Prospero homeobox protein 1 [Blomia tropicalis]|nr:Prospero homeobox protein 1 [Blomia tropicalis]